jgi:HD superfamily phosphohydrolase YqeK
VNDQRKPQASKYRGLKSDALEKAVSHNCNNLLQFSFQKKTTVISRVWALFVFLDFFGFFYYKKKTHFVAVC